MIVATAIPLALLFAFICLESAGRPGQPAVHRRDGFRDPRGRRGGDGGKHLPPARARGEGNRSIFGEVIVAAAAEVDRPIFYAVAVIVAGFLPIYVLSGPSGSLFKPMADTMIFALHRLADRDADRAAGALFAGPCARACANGATPSSKPSSRVYTSGTRLLPGASVGHDAGLGVRGWRFAAAHSAASAPNSCRIWTRARSGSAPPCPTPFPLTNRARSCRRCARSCAPSRKSPSSPTSTAGPTTAPIRRAFSTSNSTSA